MLHHIFLDRIVAEAADHLVQYLILIHESLFSRIDPTSVELISPRSTTPDHLQIESRTSRLREMT